MTETPPTKPEPAGWTPLSTGDDGPRAERQAPRSESGRGRLVLIAFSIALFACIVWFGGRESWSALLSGDPWLYLVVFFLSGMVPGLSAWRLRALVKAASGHDAAPWRRFFHINMTAIALGLFLPRNAAMLAGKAAYLRTVGVPLVRGTWAVLVENVVDLLFLLAIVLPGAVVIVRGVSATGFLVANAACVAALLVFAVWARGRDWRGYVAGLVQRVPFVSRRLPTPEDGFVPGPVRAVPMLGVTVLIHTLMALRAYAIALAIGLEPSWLVFAAAYPLTQLGLALAVAPGALGTLDASWLGLLLLLGLPHADALAFTVALRACIMVFPIAWYGVSSLLSLTIPSHASPNGLPSSVPTDGDIGP